MTGAVRPRASSVGVLGVLLASTGCSAWFGESELDANAPLVAVLGHRAEDGQVSAPLLDALDEVRIELLLKDRGYRSIPAAVTATLLRSSGAETPEPTEPDALAAMQRSGVDYLLVRTVSKAGLGIDFRLHWRLIDVRSGTRVWSEERVGGPGRQIGTAWVGPLGIADEPQLSDDPTVGRGQQPELKVIRTETLDQQAREVNERIVRQLPSP